MVKSVSSGGCQFGLRKYFDGGPVWIQRLSLGICRLVHRVAPKRHKERSIPN